MEADEGNVIGIGGVYGTEQEGGADDDPYEIEEDEKDDQQIGLICFIISQHSRWQLGLVVARGHDQQSYSTPGPVSTGNVGWVIICRRVNHFGL